MRRTLIVTVLVGLLVFASVGVARQSAYTVYNVGGSSCSDWIAEHKKPSPSTSMSAWVAGWVSAAGFYYGVELKKTDVRAMDAWMDQYCAANPSDTLSDAAPKLVEFLRAK